MAADATTLSVGGVEYDVWRLDDVSHLPFSLRILLENVLRTSTEADAEAVRTWKPADEPSREIGFMPARVLLQDFTGVPVGPFHGREAIAAAYRQMPPDDQIELVGAAQENGDELRSRYAWLRDEGREAGDMIVRRDGDKIAHLVVTFDQAS